MKIDFPIGPTSNSVSQFIQDILADARYEGQIAAYRILPEAEPIYSLPRIPWSAAVQGLLAKKGIRLYSHQAVACDHIRAGHSIVAATPTASGKSLIYNLPFLEQHLKDPDATALYLFPLKALAQDQLGALKGLGDSWPKEARPDVAIYDGDTTDYMRRKIRSSPPSALITNPEMLHLALLPYHQSWATFLSSLAYVIVDEAHTYRGVFGSNMAQVFRRLNRVASHYGASPTFIFCTATLGNPAELAQKLHGGMHPPVLIDQSGAPHGKKHFVFVNPDQAASTCAIDLLKRALARGLRTIVYCQSRRMTELISLWAGSEAEEWAGRISSYRAGYLAEERREIEARMASGELLAVISTSALELGIDIGGLDVCIMVGYPGTKTQTLQRSGRVGRSGQEAAILLVTGEDALDQYYARHPWEFFDREPERAAINPENELILERHIECAAAELPLSAPEPYLASGAVKHAVSRLEQRGILGRTADGSQWIAYSERPHRKVNLRGGGSTYTMEDAAGSLIGTMDNIRAWKEAHPGAVYLHRGRSYISTEIDDGRMRILMEPMQVTWYTRARVRKETVILQEYGRHDLGRSVIFFGKLRISEQISGYERRATSGNNLLNVTPLDAPPIVFETEGIWFVIPEEIRKYLETEFLHFMGSIHALEHAMIGMLPLQVMADRNDFGGISIPLHPQLGYAAVFVYDGLPGGAGLCRSVFDSGRSILQSTLAAVKDCSCEDGCPSCIQSPKCGAGNRPLSKAGCITLLQELLKAGNEGEKIAASLTIDSPPDSFELKFPVEAPQPTPQPLSPSSGCLVDVDNYYVVFDVETRYSAKEVGGWDNAAQMGVSVAVLYDSQEDAYFAYEQDALEEMFARMARANQIIGFNSIRFDYRVLQPYTSQYAKQTLNLYHLPTLDILQKVYERLNYRISLDNIGQATLGAAKSGDGMQALRWWREGKIEQLKAYCKKDVEITRDLYLFGRREGYLLFTNKAGLKTRIPVDFTCPDPASKN